MLHNLPEQLHFRLLNYYTDTVKLERYSIKSIVRNSNTSVYCFFQVEISKNILNPFALLIMYLVCCSQFIATHAIIALVHSSFNRNSPGYG